MPAVADHNRIAVIHDRPRVAVAAGGFRQPTGDVHKRHGRCRLENPLPVRGDLRADLAQKRSLKLLLLFLRVEHLVLVLL